MPMLLHIHRLVSPMPCCSIIINPPFPDSAILQDRKNVPVPIRADTAALPHVVKNARYIRRLISASVRATQPTNNIHAL